MSDIAKRTLLKIKRNSEIYDLFVKSNARNVDCFDAEGNKITLYKALVNIYNQFAENEADKKAQVAELQKQIDFIVENSDAEAIDSLKEVANWIKEHEGEYKALADLTVGLDGKTVAEYVTDAIAASEAVTNAKIAEVQSNLTTAKNELQTSINTVNTTLTARIDSEVETLNNTIEDNYNTLDSKIDTTKEEMTAELKRRVPDDEAGNGSVLVTRNGVTSWEDLIEIVDEIDVATMKEGHLYCVMLEDDPIEANQDNILEAMAESDNIVLTGNVTLPAGTIYDGTIDAQGYTITLEG